MLLPPIISFLGDMGCLGDDDTPNCFHDANMENHHGPSHMSWHVQTCFDMSKLDTWLGSLPESCVSLTLRSALHILSQKQASSSPPNLVVVFPKLLL